MSWARTVRHQGVVHGLGDWPVGPWPVRTYCWRKIWKTEEPFRDNLHVRRDRYLERAAEPGPCELGDWAVSCVECLAPCDTDG